MELLQKPTSAQELAFIRPVPTLVMAVTNATLVHTPPVVALKVTLLTVRQKI